MAHSLQLVDRFEPSGMGLGGTGSMPRRSVFSRLALKPGVAMGSGTKVATQSKNKGMGKGKNEYDDYYKEWKSKGKLISKPRPDTSRAAGSYVRLLKAGCKLSDFETAEGEDEEVDTKTAEGEGEEEDYEEVDIETGDGEGEEEYEEVDIETGVGEGEGEVECSGCLKIRRGLLVHKECLEELHGKLKKAEEEREQEKK